MRTDKFALEIIALAVTFLALTPISSQAKALGARNSTVSNIDKTESTKDKEKLLALMNDMESAILKGDLASISKFLHDRCTTYNEATGKIITGKDAVLAHYKMRFEQFSADSDNPLISYKIDKPYINIHGTRATATYSAKAKFGGKTSREINSKVTETFEKSGGNWKSLYYRSHWKIDDIINGKQVTSTSGTTAEKQDSQNDSDSEDNGDIEEIGETGDGDEKFRKLLAGTEALSLLLSDISNMTEDLRRAQRCLREMRQEISRDSLAINIKLRAAVENARSLNSSGSTAIETKSDYFLPPRKEWLELYARQLDEIFSLINKDMQGLKSDSEREISEKELLEKSLEIINQWNKRYERANRSKDELLKIVSSDANGSNKLGTSIDTVNEQLNSLIDTNKMLWRLFKKN